MSDEKDAKDAKPAKKKGKLGRILIMGVGGIVLIGGGIAGGLYASGSPLMHRGGGAAASADAGPHLVPKSEQKRFSAGADGKSGDASSGTGGGQTPPAGSGGDKFASNYYEMDKEFTSNLQNSVHFIQVGIAVSTPYDDSVINNLKTNEIAVRSSILMALGDATEDQVFTSQGKQLLQAHLVKAINDTLKQKEGFGGISNVYFTNFVVQ
jgi:flagellar FliL protein